jgi:predicted transcriptional regulator
MFDEIPKSILVFLQELGFTNTEIVIIKHLLKNNEQTLRQLEKSTGKSTGVLSTSLKKLIAKKIVSKEEINNSPTYLINDTRQIVLWADRTTSQDIKKTKQKIDDLENFTSTFALKSVRPKVRYYSGIEGIRLSYNEILANNPDEICGYFAVRDKESLDAVKQITQKFIKERIEKNIHARNIAIKGKHAVSLKLRDKEQLRETRIVPSELFPTVNSEIILYKSFIHTISIGENGALAVIIDDEQMARLHQTAFELAWVTADKEDKKIQEEIKKFNNPDDMFKI